MSDGYPGLAAIWEEERQRRQALKIEEPLSPPPSAGMGQTQEQLQEMCRWQFSFFWD